MENILNMHKMKIIDEQKIIINLLNKDNIGNDSKICSKEVFNKALNEFILNSKPNQHTVLGFDIYKYSHYEKEKQRLLPLIFFFLYNFVLSDIQKSNILFKDRDIKYWNDLFISTGDGGFQIFPSPIHAIPMLIEFHYALRLFNEGNLLPELNKYIGNIEIRYCLTHGEVYRINHKHYHNHYGEAIINCSRIISLDKLNRFLIDENVYKWFLMHFGGIESLELITWNFIFKKKEVVNLVNLDLKEEFLDTNFLNFKDNEFGKYNRIKSTDIQKIGQIKIKDSDFSIYSVYLKAIYNDDSETRIISVGNQNSNGLI